jgi:hypothetical protein
MVNHKNSECTAPTLTGGRSSNTEENISSTSKTRRQSMSTKERMVKDKKLSCGRNTTDGTKDGELSIKTNIPRSNQRVTTPSSDSISVDHSTSDQECQCKELLNVLATPILDIRDMPRVERHNNGSSMEEARLSKVTTGRTEQSKSPAVETHKHSE